MHTQRREQSDEVWLSVSPASSSHHHTRPHVHMWIYDQVRVDAHVGFDFHSQELLQSEAGGRQRTGEI